MIRWHGVAPPSAPSLHTAMTDDSLLDGLLSSFDNIFTEPRGLPPVHARDHHIILKPDVVPVVVRSYRYPVAHKVELERQCAAMIEQSIVRAVTPCSPPSCSSSRSQMRHGGSASTTAP